LQHRITLYSTAPHWTISVKKKATKKVKTKVTAEDTPWQEGDPSKKISLNVPFPEPLHMQLEYLIEHRAITSKSSFIRDAVARACEEEVQKIWKVREAVRRMDAGEKKRGVGSKG
jgi:Arc/MetJ-type ribon-helix-helix transcriptional regulator